MNRLFLCREIQVLITFLTSLISKFRTVFNYVLYFVLSYAGAGAQSAAGEAEYNGSNMDFLEDFDNFDVYLPHPTYRQA